MAPPPSTPAVSPVVALVVRVLTFLGLIISVIIIATNSFVSDAVDVKVKFDDFYAYRYMLAAGVLGMAYTLLQIAFTIFFVTSGNRLGGETSVYVDFYGDKALSYVLATGAAAAFGLTVDLNRGNQDSQETSFLNKANAAASLVFIAFIFSAASSIFSSFSLPKRS